MNTNTVTLLISIVALGFSLIIPVLLSRRQGKVIQKNLVDIIEYAQSLEAIIEAEIPNIKRAHSLMGTIGNQTKEAYKAEQALLLDVTAGQLGIDPEQAIELLNEISPRAAGIVKKNPEILTQLAPKILQYMEAHKGDSPAGGQTTLTGPSKAWT